MNISAAIMAHPTRQKQAAHLAYELTGYPFLSVNVVYDEINSEWHTGKRALKQGIGKGDWHVVIQDDAILTPDFYDNIVSALTALREKTLVSLYTGTSRPLPLRVAAATKKAPYGSFLWHQQLMWGVGIVIPTDHIEPMLEFVEDIALQYDNKIGEFYCQNGLNVYYTMPSLVDHDDDLDSLIDGHGRAINPERRVALQVATEHINWSNHKIFI